MIQVSIVLRDCKWHKYTLFNVISVVLLYDSRRPNVQFLYSFVVSLKRASILLSSYVEQPRRRVNRARHQKTPKT